MVKRSVVLALAFAFMLSVPLLFAQPMQKQEMPGMMPGKKMSPEEMAKKDEERVTKRLEELTVRLGLTADQQAKVKAILTSTAASIRQLMQQTHEKVGQILKQDKESIKALLTDEQKAKLGQEPQGPGPGPEGPQPPPPAGQE